LSNTKQIGTGLLIYLNDFDDTTPSVWADPSDPYHPDPNARAVDVWQVLQPHIKDTQVFFDPERTDSNSLCSYPTFNGLPGAPRLSNACLGYGYNWGFLPKAGGGLFTTESYDASSNLLVDKGVSATAAESPAGMAVFGDTTSEARYTMSALAGILDENVLGTDASVQHNSRIRHGGQLNFTFFDGHAKSVAIKGGTLPSTPIGVVYTGLPADSSKRATMYCLSSDATIDISALTGGAQGYPSTLPCSQAVTLPEQFGLQLWPN
jgi:prepilin-type processing-associated H-X9-DG protein